MIAVYRFFTDYAPDVEYKTHTHPMTGEEVISRVKVPGKFREIHKVEYGPLGSDKTRVVAIVEKLKPKLEIGMDVQPGSAVEAAMVKWQFIEPLYKRWLEGQSITPDGTPLAAWSGVGPEQAEALRRRDIFTVQQLSELSDTHVMQYGIAGLRVLRDNAKRFVQTLGTVHFEEALAEKDIEIAGLRDTLSEMQQMMRQMQANMVVLQEAAARPSAALFGEGGSTEQTENPDDGDTGNDDAFGGDATEKVVKVDRPRKQARAR